MSKWQANSFQVPNAIVDELLCEVSGNALKLYLIIVRKTKGWQKEYDSISVSQFIKISGIKKKLTVTRGLSELITIGLVEAVKSMGEITSYKISDQLPKRVVPKMGTTPHNGKEPVPIMDTTTSAHNGYSTKETIKTTKQKQKETKTKKIPLPAKSFKVPTKNEMSVYNSEKNLNIDIGHFFDHYENNSWRVGRHKMKSWKLAMNNWARNNKKFTGANNAKSESNAEQNERIVRELQNAKQGHDVRPLEQDGNQIPLTLEERLL